MTKKKPITEKEIAMSLVKILLDFIKKTKQPLMVYSALNIVKESLGAAIIDGMQTKF